ncbi:hypothetical protein JN853_14435 [Pseudomonas syringae pv. actinidiae ICMP 9853]|nr:hypothetical protein JN853_14435 [Pseudomonas syringae pv. actinidiae ICMP 9853]
MIRAGGRGSKLARELPGTGSKTGRLGSSDTTEVAGFRAAAQPIASKLARPPGRSPVVGQIDNVRF